MNSKILDSAENYYNRYSLKLAIAAAFLAPLKLALMYLPLFTLLLLWLGSKRFKVAASLDKNFLLAGPFYLLIFLGLFTAIFGVDFLRSVNKLAPLLFYGCAIFAFAEAGRDKGYQPIILALLAGQSLASFYSIAEGAFRGDLPRLFLGAVTESGQLCITILVAIGFLAYYNQKGIDLNLARAEFSSRSKELLLALAASTLFICTAFSSEAASNYVLPVILLAASSLWVVWCLIRVRAFQSPLNPGYVRFLLIALVIPLLFAALLVNLKRGPWLGVFIGTFLFLLLYDRKWVLPVIILSTSLLVFIEPVRERLEQSADHFFIYGGRSIIWQIGSDLGLQYPLGIGFKNSRFLQNFSKEIPSEHNHFHNNIINITTELGWLGLWIYLWWIASITLFSFKSGKSGQNRFLCWGIGCAVISWQVAGLVEYNFGDSQVLWLVLIILGLLASIADDNKSTA